MKLCERVARLPALSLSFSLSPVNFRLMLVIWQLTRQLLQSISHVCINKKVCTHTYTHTRWSRDCESWNIQAPSFCTLCERREAHRSTQTTHTVLGVPWVLDDGSGLIKGVHTHHLILLLEKDFPLHVK